ncbi:unnamed protein product [Phytophthora lilii]|uniref:Unnamed protein product n=1 Tax=Phytophthora lilii TaxID=2077276 RepID=A0A9W6U583_9STRA|nr:unnamed protein product [Phytophthora lilii]
MVAAGELAHATQLVKKMVAAGFEPDISQMAQKQPDTAETSGSIVESEGFLTMPLRDDKIVLCDSEKAVKNVADFFFGQSHNSKPSINADGFDDVRQAIGLDVEWKPIMSRSKLSTAVASILQIASADRVFIIDLLALHVSWPGHSG